MLGALRVTFCVRFRRPHLTPRSLGPPLTFGFRCTARVIRSIFSELDYVSENLARWNRPYSEQSVFRSHVRIKFSNPQMHRPRRASLRCLFSGFLPPGCDLLRRELLEHFRFEDVNGSRPGRPEAPARSFVDRCTRRGTILCLNESGRMWSERW